MKTLLLGTSLIVATSSALAQGTVTFANATSSYGAAVPDHLLRWNECASLLSPLITAGGLVSSNYGGVNLSTLRAQLFYGASTATSPGSLTAVTDAPATFRASTSANAGAWLGGGRTLLGFQPGETVKLNIIVWDSATTADPLSPATQSGLYGTSGLFNYTIPAIGSPPTAYLPSGQPPFTVGCIPEPSTFALAGLGAAALLIFRRRK